MTFAWPHAFWLLLLPVALFALELARKRRAADTRHAKILRAEAGADGLILTTRAKAARRTRPWLGLGLALCFVALARPQWGRIEEPVFDQAREILIAIDLSRSMLAQDVKPSRLERAKLLTQSLLEKLAGERVGLVTFSGTAFLQSPLSSDYEILREFLPALNPDFLPEGGTNYSALIDTALSAFGSTAAADRFLIVLSDGEATDDGWKSKVSDLQKKGIRVIGLGIGTGAGAMIPDGAGAFVKDDRGAVVLSKLETGTLQELAETTRGTYRDASTWLDLAGVLTATVEAGQKGKFVEKNTVRLVERFQWPLALGLWCLLMAYCFEFPVRPRPRELKLGAKAASAPSAPAPEPPALATAATTALLLLGLLRFPSDLPAAPAPSPAANPAAPAPPLLGKVVARLAAQDVHTARDWAEVARETVTWGQHIQSESRPVPAGPVRDALAAVELGAALDPKAADWTKLQTELEALLRPPEQKKNDQQQSQDQKDQPQNQDQSKQDQSDQQKPQDQSKPQDQQQQQKQQDQQKDDPTKANQPPKDSAPQNQPDSPPKQEPKPGESAFGDMQDRQPPPPPSRDTQKVGGAPEKKNEEKIPSDPQLALPLQKLDQIRNQDSPAQLFQMMDTDKSKPPGKKGKDW